MVSANDVRAVILDLFADQFTALGHDPGAVPDELDLLGDGIIDSLGLLELVSTIEDRFSIEVDLSGLDAEHLSVIGPLSEHIASLAQQPT